MWLSRECTWHKCNLCTSRPCGCHMNVSDICVVGSSACTGAELKNLFRINISKIEVRWMKCFADITLWGYDFVCLWNSSFDLYCRDYHWWTLIALWVLEMYTVEIKKQEQKMTNRCVMSYCKQTWLNWLNGLMNFHGINESKVPVVN
jgi:hypothetical protein